MLKIKDNVDLSVLEKYGFEHINYEPMCDYDSQNIYKYYHLETSSGTIYNTDNKSRKLEICGYGEWKDEHYAYFDTDILYDMIMDGLIEKVGE